MAVVVVVAEGKVIWPSSSGVRMLEDSLEEEEEAGVRMGRGESE